MSFALTHPAGTATQAEPAGSAWPATAGAADAELARLAELLAEAGVTVLPAAGVLAVPGLAASTDDTAGIRVRTTNNPPHALYVITAGQHHPARRRQQHLRPPPPAHRGGRTPLRRMRCRGLRDVQPELPARPLERLTPPAGAPCAPGP
ncbi:hypothetical protein AQF52_7908 [Streptomyces venezuelae]|uniref:hypothetical protein n=1 Tax=Streptomyces gardneri TaxID=66892 RepID=UPI0006BE058F|nr:hypothetical protein [Streptomyces gardneri]ALO13491.1 hypothetical protein AQF52_7908 [Streptomyces venezuelae]QPK50113.1 hypothetical protein H4W23_39665 [Streptomyces gardneri]WRK41701.1 hypothetical protein U0M97_39895 [Streptomyces venezuelae]CUM35770.1 hypothetical protein BN2537_505 [Streptomyces venezuelae]